MPDLPDGRVSVADIVRLTGYPRGYVTRLLEVDALKEYLQYDPGTYPPSYPGAAVDFFKWLGSDARPSANRKGFEKVTASNVMEIVTEYVPGVGAATLPGDRLPEQPADRTTEHKAPYDAGVPAVSQENAALALVRAIESMPDATGQAVLKALAVRESPPVDDEWLTAEEAAAKLGNIIKPRSMSRYIKPIEIAKQKRYSLIMIRQYQEQQRLKLQGD